MADSVEPYTMLWGRPVAMATTFGLGAEIQSPTGLSLLLGCCIQMQWRSQIFLTAGRVRSAIIVFSSHKSGYGRAELFVGPSVVARSPNAIQWILEQNNTPGGKKYRQLLLQQESCAISKMTAQCTQYMGTLKIFGTPNYAHGYFFPKFFMGF